MTQSLNSFKSKTTLTVGDSAGTVRDALIAAIQSTGLVAAVSGVGLGVNDVAVDDPGILLEPLRPVVEEVRAKVAAVSPEALIAQLDGAIKHLSGFGIRTLTSQPPTLEELFLRHYGDEIALLEGRDPRDVGFNQSQQFGSIGQTMKPGHASQSFRFGGETVRLPVLHHLQAVLDIAQEDIGVGEVGGAAPLDPACRRQRRQRAERGRVADGLDAAPVGADQGPVLLQRYRVQAHYLSHGCFLDARPLLERLEELGVPCNLVVFSVVGPISLL